MEEYLKQNRKLKAEHSAKKNDLYPKRCTLTALRYSIFEVGQSCQQMHKDKNQSNKTGDDMNLRDCDGK